MYYQFITFLYCILNFKSPIELLHVLYKESTNNTNLGNDPEHVGAFQLLRGGAIADWSKYKKISPEDAYSYVQKSFINNLEVAFWYYYVKIPSYLNSFNKDNTTNNRIVAYNAGIGNLIRNNIPTITRNYLHSFQERKAQYKRTSYFFTFVLLIPITAIIYSTYALFKAFSIK